MGAVNCRRHRRQNRLHRAYVAREPLAAANGKKEPPQTVFLHAWRTYSMRKWLSRIRIRDVRGVWIPRPKPYLPASRDADNDLKGVDGLLSHMQA